MEVRSAAYNMYAAKQVFLTFLKSLLLLNLFFRKTLYPQYAAQ